MNETSYGSSVKETNTIEQGELKITPTVPLIQPKCLAQILEFKKAG